MDLSVLMAETQMERTTGLPSLKETNHKDKKQMIKINIACINQFAFMVFNN
jgi:hypothetical protein